MLKKYLLYLLRWQLSTPPLALCCWAFSSLGVIPATIIANLIGGMVFFFVDKQIFGGKNVTNKR